MKRSVFVGSFNYEFRMQIRRPIIWIVLFLTALLVAGLLSRSAGLLDLVMHLHNVPVLQSVVYWTNFINYVLPIAAGILIADRLPRDRRVKVQELLITTPGSLTARLFGKYLGCTLATWLPICLLYCLGIGFIFAQTGNLQVLPLALETFATIILPCMLFVGAFSIAIPAVLWVPLYQFLFLGYWFWGNLYSPKSIPTISATLLTPVGGYMSQGFFGVTMFPVGHATALQGIESLLLLLILALLIMLVLNSYLSWQQSRQ